MGYLTETLERVPYVYCHEVDLQYCTRHSKADCWTELVLWYLYLGMYVQYMRKVLDT
jgi:hypothetical protein